MFYRSLSKLLKGSVSVYRPLRGFHGGHVDGCGANPVALQMIDYALSLARSIKSDESYAEGMLVLEQCLASSSSIDESNAGSSSNSKGMVLLAMSDLLFARGKYGDAMDKLQRIPHLTNASLGLRVAAMEALVGINLQLGDDMASSVLADKCLEIVDKTKDEELENVRLRAKSVKGLVELASGNTESAKTFFEGMKMDDVGPYSLSYGEFLHVTDNLAEAKEVYQKVMKAVSNTKEFTSIKSLSACNMERSETVVAAACTLGQLQSHLGDFDSAEKTLTSALKEAEQSFGLRHPKVGVVLTCLALMFRRKGISEKESSLIVEEGLYRRASELLKVPPLESEDGEGGGLKEMASIVRGGYAQVVGLYENRKTEAGKMKRWAEINWNKAYASLPHVLNATKLTVIDSRICRAL